MVRILLQCIENFFLCTMSLELDLHNHTLFTFFQLFSHSLTLGVFLLWCRKHCQWTPEDWSASFDVQAFHVPLIFILFHLLCICISFWTLGKCYYQVYLAGVNLLDWVHNHGLDFESLLSIVCVSMMGSLRVLFYWTIFPSELKNTSVLWSVHESLIFVLFISMKEVSEWNPNHVHWLLTETTWFLAYASFDVWT